MIRLTLDSFRLVLLPTDLLLFLLLVAAVAFLVYARRREYYRVAWRQIAARPLAMVCMGICLLYASVAMLDYSPWCPPSTLGPPAIVSFRHMTKY